MSGFHAPAGDEGPQILDEIAGQDHYGLEEDTSQAGTEE